MVKSVRRRGFTIVYCGVFIIVLLGFVAFCVDMSRVRAAKSELQAAADAAALNGANGLVDGTYFSKANAVAGENKCDGTSIAFSAGNVTPGNWTNTTFIANGTPRNAIRVVAERTAAAGNVVVCPFANSIGLPSPDLRATTIVALLNQADYEWVGIDQVNLNGGSPTFKVTAFDATNTGAAESKTTVKSNGAITISGAAVINADVKYGTIANIDGASTVTGNVSTNPQGLTYPPGSQVANVIGVTPVYATTYDLTVNTNQTLPGGVYVVKNVNITNCNVTFIGPATIVCTGNLNVNNVGFTTPANLPSNLKIVATTAGSAININNLTRSMYVDFYAPDSTFSLAAPSGYYGIRGRGVFKNMNVSGGSASLWYDRSLTASSLSRRAVLVK